MNNRIIILIVVVAVFVLAGFMAYHNFEIYDKTINVPWNDKVASNNYYAFEHWLAETGHPVRVEKQTSAALIAAGPEKTALVQASLCDWENAKTILEPWIERGGFLVISFDEDVYDDDLEALLVSLSVWADYFLPDDDDEGMPELREETQFDDEDIPTLASNMDFFVAKGTDAFTINSRGKTRLVQVPLGSGALTVTGRPVFMYNENLKEGVNARLAWNLTGAQAPENNPGLLLVRGKRTSKGLFGKLAGWGNLLPPVVSVLLLIVLGFWMVIPRFGKSLGGAAGSTTGTARPIRERFLAETRFLKKYQRLDYYVQTYERELKLENAESAKEYREIIKRLRNLQTLTEKNNGT